MPRPETELLAGWGIEQAPAPARRRLVVDLCSGSGAIALAVAQELPGARVFAVERSPAALGWLRRNAAERAAAGDRPIEVVDGDVTDPELLAELAGPGGRGAVQPAVRAGRRASVPPEVAEHDPAEAVFGGADGLAVIRPVIAPRRRRCCGPAGVLGDRARRHPRRGGAGAAAADGRFTAVADHPDLAGRPRFATASRRADGQHAAGRGGVADCSS